MVLKHRRPAQPSAAHEQNTEAQDDPIPESEDSGRVFGLD